MHLENLFDAASAAIVVGGTCLATLLRCGFRDCAMTFTALAGLVQRRFDPVQAKADMASHVREMRKDGVIRTEPRHSGDPELDDATDGLIASRSATALHATHAAHKRRRNQASMRAMRTLNQAADLAPVFGLAGTLVSLSQMPGQMPGSTGGGDFTGAISMAVLTTLYGLLFGNLLLAPLARMVARRAAQEEYDRQRVLEWLEGQVADALPVPAIGRGQVAVAMRKRAVGAGSGR
jgi:Flagellar motor component